MHEAGGHRWQRIPPTDHTGRVHTSTVTVAILTLQPQPTTSLQMSDVQIDTARGSGPGGQHRNTTESCVIATHRPTGITVRIDLRSQHQSRRLALQILAARVTAKATDQHRQQHAASRRAQIGSGMRGDKIRTYRKRDNQVTDHRTGQSWPLHEWKKGHWLAPRVQAGQKLSSPSI